MSVTKKIIFLLLSAALMSSCIHSKIKFRKAKLLDPTMDPARTGGLYNGMLSSEPMLGIEKGSSQMEGSLGASCPTCGG